MTNITTNIVTNIITNLVEIEVTNTNCITIKPSLLFIYFAIIFWLGFLISYLLSFSPKRKCLAGYQPVRKDCNKNPHEKIQPPRGGSAETNLKNIKIIKEK